VSKLILCAGDQFHYMFKVKNWVKSKHFVKFIKILHVENISVN